MKSGSLTYAVLILENDVIFGLFQLSGISFEVAFTSTLPVNTLFSFFSNLY